MKEKIERFSKGDFEYELPYICLSDDEIRITTEVGKKAFGSFTISNSMARPMKGVIYSSSRWMKVLNSAFQGTENNIEYEFDARFLKEGDLIEGELCIVSDCGEKLVPFSVCIKNYYYSTTMGKIKDLFQFTNLARADWSEAKKVFLSEDFEQIILGNEDKIRFIYRSLIKGASTSQALEEFLIAIRKKSAISLSIDRSQLEYEVEQTAISDKLILTKSSWGFAEIKISTDVSFLQLDQKYLWADRFMGNTHQITFTIQPDKMRKGNNFGHIYIKSPHQTIVVDVTCKWRSLKEKPENVMREHQLWFKLEQNYLAFRMNRISIAKYLQEVRELVKYLPGPEINHYKELLLIYLAIISGKTKLARELLEDMETVAEGIRKKSNLEYSVFLYLKAIFEKEEKLLTSASLSIQEYYNRGDRDWRLLWLLLNIDRSFEESNSLKISHIKEQYFLGCRSPILYYEAVCAYNKDPQMFRDMGDFEIQVMNYGVKNELLNKDMVERYVYLATKRKNFHPVIFRCLTKLYETNETSEVLAAICSMLIKGMKRAEKYFIWYRLGVEAQLRITELYEYYMYSISESRQEPIAQQVLLYFIYNSNLSDKKKAYLYANIIRYKEKNETIYRSYYKKMEVFTAKMLESHQISKDLAVLYQDFFKGSLQSSEYAKHLPYVIYRYELICHNPNICSVIVTHKELGVEEVIPLSDHMAQVDIYTSNAEIILVDTMGNRFIETIEYTLTPYLKAEEYEDYCSLYSNHPMLLLHLFDRYENHRVMNDKAISLRREVLTLEGLAEEYIATCCQSLIDHYYENYNNELLEYYLQILNLDKVRSSERPKYMEIMVARSNYKQALGVLETFGVEGISINRLVKLCSGWILQPEGNYKNDFMVYLCYHVYTHMKYDDAILKYLIQYFNGSTREMYKLWKTAREFELDTHDLEERLLTQMLFTQSYVDEGYKVFESYYKAVTNHLLVKAFLSFFAYQYLIHDMVIHEQLFQIMRRELNYEPNELYLLAWLKHLPEKSILTENEIIHAEFNIQNLVRKGIILPFFQNFKNKINLPERLLDRTFITYRCDPRSQVYLHYRLLKSDSDKSDSDEFITERLPNVFMGIHLKEIILFYHETIQYYITEESAEGKNITESFYITYEGEVDEDGSKFSEINLMLLAKELNEDNTFHEMLENYAKKEYMISACFKPLD